MVQNKSVCYHIFPFLFVAFVVGAVYGSGVTACVKLLPKSCHLLFCRSDEKGYSTPHASKLTIAFAFNGFSF